MKISLNFAVIGLLIASHAGAQCLGVPGTLSASFSGKVFNETVTPKIPENGTVMSLERGDIPPGGTEPVWTTIQSAASGLDGSYSLSTGVIATCDGHPFVRMCADRGNVAKGCLSVPDGTSPARVLDIAYQEVEDFWLTTEAGATGPMATVSTARMAPPLIASVSFPNGNFAKNPYFDDDATDWSAGTVRQTASQSVSGNVLEVEGPTGAFFNISKEESAYDNLLGKAVVLSMDVHKVAESPLSGVKLKVGTALSTAFSVTGGWKRISFSVASLSAGTPAGSPLQFGVIESAPVTGFRSFYVDNVLLELGTTPSKPEIASSFADGMQREIESSVRFGNEDIVTINRYDALSRMDKVSKPYQLDPAIPHKTRHAFEPNAFAHANWYYRQNGPDHGPGPEAGERAFNEFKFESNGTDRVAEVVPPGTNFAPGSGHTIVSSYRGVGSVSLLDFSPSAANDVGSRYFQTSTKDENGDYTVHFTDMDGNIVGQGFAGRNGEFSTLKKFSYDVFGNQTQVVKPSGVTTNTTYDTFGQAIGFSDPDRGAPEFIFDQEGNKRFSRKSTDVAKDQFVAFKYDGIGRIVSVGIVLGSANFTQANADNREYPSSFAILLQRYFWDKLPDDGSAEATLVQSEIAAAGYTSADFTFLKSRLTAVVNYNHFPTVFEENKIDGGVFRTFSYDDKGRVAFDLLGVRGADVQKTAYEYDLMGKTTKVTVQGKNGTSQVTSFSYDETGRLQGAKDGDGKNLANYVYWPAGGIRTANTGDDPASPGNPTVVTDYDFHVRDWLQKISHMNRTRTTTFFQQSVAYEASTGGPIPPSQLQFNGNISQEQYYLAGVTDPYRLNNYKYDYRKRLLENNWASGTTLAGMALSKTTLDSRYRFDEDGGILGLSRGVEADPSTSQSSLPFSISWSGARPDNVGTLIAMFVKVGFLNASNVEMKSKDVTMTFKESSPAGTFDAHGRFDLIFTPQELSQVKKLRLVFTAVTQQPFVIPLVSPPVDVAFDLSLTPASGHTITAISPPGPTPIPNLTPPSAAAAANAEAAEVIPKSTYEYQAGTHHLKRILGKVSGDGEPLIPRDDPNNFQYDADGNLIKEISPDISFSYDWRGRRVKSKTGTASGKIRSYNLYDEKGDRVAKLQYKGNGDEPITVGVPTNAKDYPNLNDAFAAARAELTGITNSSALIYAIVPPAGLSPAPDEFTTPGSGNYIDIYGFASVNDLLPGNHLVDQTNDPELVAATYYLGGVDEIVRKERRIDKVTNTDKEFFNLYAQGQIGRINGDGSKEFYLNDNRGSSMLVVNSTAAAANLYAYDYFPYGKQLALTVGTSGKVTQTFTGKELDEDGTYHFGVRSFDPEIAQWLSPDPANQFSSPYAYAGNGSNPITGRDKDGSILDEILDAAFIVYDVGSLAYHTATGDEEAARTDVHALVADVACAALPLATGGGLAVRAAEKAAVKLETRIIKVAEEANHIAKVEKTAKNAERTLKEAEKVVQSTEKTVAKAEKAVQEVEQVEKAVVNAKPLPKLPRGKGSVAPKNRDPKRVWTNKENARKLKQQGDKCAQCKKPLKAKDGKGHHKNKRHADGGKTDDANHAVVCETCHKDIHSP